MNEQIIFNIDENKMKWILIELNYKEHSQGKKKVERCLNQIKPRKNKVKWQNKQRKPKSIKSKIVN